MCRARKIVQQRQVWDSNLRTDDQQALWLWNKKFKAEPWRAACSKSIRFSATVWEALQMRPVDRKSKTFPWHLVVIPAIALWRWTARFVANRAKFWQPRPTCFLNWQWYQSLVKTLQCHQSINLSNVTYDYGWSRFQQFTFISLLFGENIWRLLAVLQGICGHPSWGFGTNSWIWLVLWCDLVWVIAFIQEI